MGKQPTNSSVQIQNSRESPPTTNLHCPGKLQKTEYEKPLNRLGFTSIWLWKDPRNSRWLEEHEISFGAWGLGWREGWIGRIWNLRREWAKLEKWERVRKIGDGSFVEGGR